MTRFERLLTPSSAVCCVCDHELTVRELEEFRCAAEERLQDAVHCPACMGEHLLLCRECGGRYTVEGMCDECAVREYARAG